MQTPDVTGHDAQLVVIVTMTDIARLPARDDRLWVRVSDLGLSVDDNGDVED